MKGYATHLEGRPSGRPAGLHPWEVLALDAVAEVIEFWGFKGNHGRMWALLYLRGEAMSAGELQELLGLSRGAMSMLTRELLDWGVLHRVHSRDRSGRRFAAEEDLVGMVRRVLSRREQLLFERVRGMLDQARKKAASARAPRETRDRLARMITLASVGTIALGAFQKSARFDFRDALGVLSTVAGRGRSK